VEFKNRRSAARRGLTLLELVVVLVILVALAALIVPQLSGVSSQSASATNATLVGDVNRAVQLFEARYAKQPSGWDSLLNSSDAYFTKLNPALTGTDVTKPNLQIATLDANQAASLQNAGITGFHDADESRVAPPSDNSTVFRFLSSGKKVVTLVKTPIASGHGSTFIDKAFNLNQFRKDPKGVPVFDYEYVVCGLGGPTSVKGATLTELPLVQSANPVSYYSRVLVVYKIPPAGSTTTFAAQYVGAFLPDGTTQRENVENFTTANN
jgi:prepilin-type N-terminal cleavage/methylation domain-containing protein